MQFTAEILTFVNGEKVSKHRAILTSPEGHFSDWHKLAERFEQPEKDCPLSETRYEILSMESVRHSDWENLETCNVIQEGC